jgi:hypothetical protein
VRRFTLGLAVALAVAGASGCSGESETQATSTAAAPASTRPGEHVYYYGHIAALDRSGEEYRLRFDPAWFLSGETANVAAAEDHAVEPGQPVPNDNYVLDEGDRLLTFRVPAVAHVTVLTRHGQGQFGATPVTVRQLMDIVHGTSSVRLFEPLESGVWLTVHVDAVESIDQQYRP